MNHILLQTDLLFMKTTRTWYRQMFSPCRVNVYMMHNLIKPTFLHVEDFDLFKNIGLADILMKQLLVIINIIITLLKETTRKTHGLYYAFRDMLVLFDVLLFSGQQIVQSNFKIPSWLSNLYISLFKVQWDRKKYFLQSNIRLLFLQSYFLI